MNINRPYVRQKRKPPKGTRCDCASPAATTGHAPTLRRCPNPATVEFKGGPFRFETWVCEECASRIETEAPAPSAGGGSEHGEGG